MQIGIWEVLTSGALVLLIIKEVFTFVTPIIKRRNGNGSDNKSLLESKLSALNTKADLHFQSHDKILERLASESREAHEMMYELSLNISRQTDILQELVQHIIKDKHN